MELQVTHLYTGHQPRPRYSTPHESTVTTHTHTFTCVPRRFHEGYHEWKGTDAGIIEVSCVLHATETPTERQIIWFWPSGCFQGSCAINSRTVNFLDAGFQAVLLSLKPFRLHHALLTPDYDHIVSHSVSFLGMCTPKCRFTVFDGSLTKAQPFSLTNFQRTNNGNLHLVG